jgi:hypothetical protein
VHTQKIIGALATTANSKTPDSSFSIVVSSRKKTTKLQKNNKASSVIIILANHPSRTQLNSRERKKESKKGRKIVVCQPLIN